VSQKCLIFIPVCTDFVADVPSINCKVLFATVGALCYNFVLTPCNVLSTRDTLSMCSMLDESHA